jgi:RNA polymerase sigma factor for flagellar operon FliA
MVGLLEAADNFQVERGIVFEAYARIRVRGAVQDALRRLDHLSRRMRQKSRSIRETHQKMERAAGRPVSDVEVATQMGVAIEDIQTSRTHHTAPDSLDPAVMENVSFTRLWQKELTIVEGLEAQERLEQVVEALSALPERNRLIIGLYYEAELTLKEIGQIVEVTESRVSQIMRKSVSMIREYIEEKNKMG